VANSGDVGYSPSMVNSSLTGFPLLAYGQKDSDTNDFSVKLVKAASLDGSSWSAPIDVCSSIDCGERLSLGLVQGAPAVWAVEKSMYSGQNKLYYLKAGDGTGADWSEPQLLASGPASGYIYPANSIALAGGPAIACCMSSDISPQLSWLRASDPAGSAWGASIDIPATYINTCSAIMAQGRPALAFGLAGSAGSQLQYLRADDSAGATWTAQPLELAAEGLGGGPAMSVIGGVPSIAWSSSGSELWFIRATDAAGSAWMAPEQVVTADRVGTRVALGSSNGHPVIAYFSDDNDELRVAWYQD
jgi:hypothetical protein